MDVDTGPQAAIVACTINDGRVILTGAHLDYRPSSLKGKVATLFIQL